MFQMRIHGRGGQGVVTAAELLSSPRSSRAGRAGVPQLRLGAHGRAGRGVLPDRRQPIRLREPVAEPDALIIQDATLLHQVDVFAGLAPRRLRAGQLRPELAELGLAELAERLQPDGLLIVPGDRAGADPPRPPAAQRCLLGGFAALTGRSPWTRSRPRSASGSPGRSPTATSPPRARRIDVRQHAVRGGEPCVGRSRVPGGGRDGGAVPARGDLRVPDHAADPHRRGARGDGEDGQLERCEFINVESEFAAMSVAIGASAAGRPHLHRDRSQGLLYMAEALFNAAGLGLPIVMTVANRAIGAPINIWNDHSDAMSPARRGLDPALRRGQPGGRSTCTSWRSGSPRSCPCR